MGISTPPQAIPQRPPAVSLTAVEYFDDLLYGGAYLLPTGFDGAAGLANVSVDAAHPGVWSCDMSASTGLIRWLAPTPNFFALQLYETINLEWQWMITGEPGGTRFQQSMGWSDSSGCVQNTDTASVVWSSAGCANTPGKFFYLSTDNGGSAQYINTGISYTTNFGTFKKFNLIWNKAAARISLNIDGVQVATTVTNIPASTAQLPLFQVNGFAIGPNANFWRIDYIKFSGVLVR